MIQRQWYELDIHTKEDILTFINDFKKHKPKFAGFDKETNGLHIIKARPFLIAFGFISTVTGEGFTYTHDFQRHPELTIDVMFAIITLFNRAYKVVAHNAKFDLHMMANIGYYLPFENVTDSMIYIRLAHDSVPQKFGGVPLQLKAYATAFIERAARNSEALLKQEQKKMKIARNKELKVRLAPYAWTENGKKKYWTLSKIENILSDKVVGIEGFPSQVRHIVEEWLRTTPDPDNYENLDRENLTRYAHKDIVYMLEIVEVTHPVVLARQQEKALQIEEDLLLPLFRMERVGFAFNKQYALESKERVKQYIIHLRRELQRITGQPLKVAQHAEIKKYIYQRWQILLESTGQEALSEATLPGDAKEFVKIILDLRTLEKWYSTYICKWLDEEVEGRIYTTIQQVKPVSGRVSSNFQQFPGYPIYDADGNELFHPRRMIKVSPDKDYIAYVDYSQIELRFQAIYTIYVSGGDKNLCRAYMPFKCKNRFTNEEFDPTNPEHLTLWDSGNWIDPETNAPWQKVDLHSATTHAAFPDIEEDHPDWKKYRKMGKTTNFACNYNAQASTLHYQMGYTWELAEKLYNAYNATFPDISKYRDYVINMTGLQGYVENLFGRRYYGSSAHNNSNYLVQGSAADFMKLKIIAADKFIQDNNLDIRLQMTIHDELSFELNHNELPDLQTITKIMEDLPGTVVPIVADLEITKTTWDSKEDYDKIINS